MTPLAIETLLAVYCSPYRELNTLGIVQCRDLIQPDNRCPPPDGKCRHGYVLTDRGRAMVEALTVLPLPTKYEVWTVELRHNWAKNDTGAVETC